MNFRKIIRTFVFCAIMLIGVGNVLSEQSINGLYLGQKPPELIPEKFMPGVISTAENYYDRNSRARRG